MVCDHTVHVIIISPEGQAITTVPDWRVVWWRMTCLVISRGRVTTLSGDKLMRFPIATSVLVRCWKQNENEKQFMTKNCLLVIYRNYVF